MEARPALTTRYLMERVVRIRHIDERWRPRSATVDGVLPRLGVFHRALSSDRKAGPNVNHCGDCPIVSIRWPM